RPQVGLRVRTPVRTAHHHERNGDEDMAELSTTNTSGRFAGWNLRILPGDTETEVHLETWTGSSPNCRKLGIDVDRDELLQALGAANPDDDERAGAWEAVARHEFFASCYDEDRPLVDAILERLDATVAQLNALAVRLNDATDKRRNAERRAAMMEGQLADRDQLREQLDESQRTIAGLLRLIAIT